MRELLTLKLQGLARGMYRQGNQKNIRNPRCTERILDRNKNWCADRILRHRKTRNFPTDISHITEDFVTEVLQKFLGEITQKPPIFSAIKVDGERAYDLARAGVSVEMKFRKTQFTISKIFR